MFLNAGVFAVRNPPLKNRDAHIVARDILLHEADRNALGQRIVNPVKQMNALSTLGLLSRFVGMLTDSRSFLSYPRHEYFRRILCNLIGDDIEQGKLPRSEMAQLHQMVKDICYNNADRYFGF